MNRIWTACASGLRRCALAFLVLGLFPTLVHAQVPAATYDGLPAEPLIGESFCIAANLTNAGSATGYGPYLIVSVDEYLRQLSIDFVDVQPRLEKIGDFDASGQLVDPISGTVINGNEGGAGYLLFYPVGSVEPSSPALVMNICGVVQPGAEINLPLDLDFRPGFEFGDTPTGDNGPLVGVLTESSVTPQLARVRKTNSAPENERPPGPSHIFNYSYQVDVSEGIAIVGLMMDDNLPPPIQWTGGAISIDAPLGVNCTVTGEPSFPPIPAGLLQVECDALTGTAPQGDMVVTLPVYITDILDERVPDSQLLINTVDLTYSQGGASYSNSDSSNVLAVHAAAQKTVEGNAAPGNTLTYSVKFQVTDYPDDGVAGASRFVITDVLPDGTTFASTMVLVVDGTVVPVTPSLAPGPGPGETTVTWDVVAALGGTLPNGGDGRLRYQVTVDDYYSDGTTPVQAADVLTNKVNLGYDLTEGGSGNNGSSSEAQITPNIPRKTISDPDPLPAELMPGEEITFRLELSIPAGQTSSVIFTDYLPRPVFDVADFAAATDVVVPPPPFLQIAPLTVTPNAGNNSIVLDYGDIDVPQNSTLAVDLKARITSEPFADDLFLTNLFGSSYQNAVGETIAGLRAVGLTVGAPDLVITKGVLAVDNAAAIIDPPAPADPATGLVDGNVTGVDAADVITYHITVENVGSQNAYNVLVNDLPVPELSCNQGSIQVRDGLGASLAFSGDLATGLALTNPLPGNDKSPPGGGAPYGSDTALIQVQCTLASSVSPNSKHINTASVTWTSTSSTANPFPPRQDDAFVQVARPLVEKTVVDIAPGYSSKTRSPHIGEMVSYRVEITVPEGTSPEVQLVDLLDDGLAFVDVTSITATPGLSTDVVGGFAGILANVSFKPEPAAGGGSTAPDRRLLIGPEPDDYGFGTITNGDTDNTAADVVTIEYRTRVLNSINNQSAQKRRNKATWSWLRQGTKRNSVSARAPNLTIVEPDLRLSKSLFPDTGDQTSPPQVTLTLQHSGASAGDSFDLTLSDQLPFPMVIAGAVDETACAANPPDTLTVSPDGKALSASWANFPQGATCTLSFATTFATQLPTGVTLTNCAVLDWESMQTPVLPAPPANMIAVERTGNDADAGGSANDYRFENCDSFKVFDVGITKSVSATSQPQTDKIPGTPTETESLTIGEEVIFDLVLTIPESQTLRLNALDLLPVSDMVLEYLDVAVVSIGDHLSPTNPDPVPDINDRDGDGVLDSVLLDFGSILHQPLNGVTDDRDRIVLQVRARVPNLPINQNNLQDANTAIVEFVPDAKETDTYGIEIVEPVLAISKTADENEVEAGDRVNFRVVIDHAQTSRMSGQDVQVRDVLPSELALVPGSVALGPFCSAAPDSLQESGNSFSANWASFPLDAVCEIDFVAEVAVTAITGSSIQNAADLEWTTLDTQGDPNDRLYQLRDTWNLVVSPPGLEKNIVATSSLATLFQAGNRFHEVTIGETATFHVVASFPDGTTLDASLEDQLPDGYVALEIVDSRILSIGEDLSLSSGAQVGDAATDCVTPAPDCGRWLLGTVINLPDTSPNPDSNDVIVFEIDALVLDDPLNSGGPGDDKNLINTARLFNAGDTLTAQEVFDLVEPKLQLDKVTESGGYLDHTGAGELHRFTLLIGHTDESTVSARNVTVTDELSSSMLWEGNSTVTSNCPGLQIQAPAPGGTGNAVFSFDTLPLLLSRCAISYDVRAVPDLVVPGIYPNRAVLEWESAPGSTESRMGEDSALAALFTFSEAFIGKEVIATSVPETGSAQGDPDLQDVTIGEIIEYEITTYFAEGTTEEVVLVDVLQQDVAGFIEFIGGELYRIGGNLAAQPGEPVIAGNTITVDYGAVVNQADGVIDQDDAIVYRLRARVRDLPQNADGGQIVNSVELRFRGAGGFTEVRSDNVAVDVVTPQLEVDKRFVDLTGARATMEFDLRNIGTAPAYSVYLVDRFDEARWEPLSLESAAVPPGFELVATSAGGFTTVELRVASAAGPPSAQQILMPGQNRFLSFSMLLRNNGALPVASVNNTIDATAQSIPPDDATGREVRDSASDTLLLPRLDLLKTWTGPNNPGLPGDVLTYTLTLRNTGLNRVTDVVVQDAPDVIGEFQAGSVLTNPAASGQPGGAIDIGNSPVDKRVEVSFAEVNPGEEVFVRYEVRVPYPYPAGQLVPEQLTNQASARSRELADILSDDPDTSAIDDATVVPLVADPLMVVQKTDNAVLTQPGNLVVYDIDYGNGGDQDATGVVVTETVPDYTRFAAASSSAGWSCSDDAAAGTVCRNPVGQLAGGSSGLLQFAVQIDSAVAAGVDRIRNTVTLEEDGLEFSGSSDPSTDSDTDVTLLFAQPDLSVTKDDGGISVVPGQSYLYAIVTRNPGVQAASGVVLTEQVPDNAVFSAAASGPSTWSCADGSLPGTVCILPVGNLPAGFGSQAFFGLTVLDPVGPDVNQIVNTVTAADDGSNSLRPLVDVDTDTTPVVGLPDLVISKSTAQGVAKPGRELVFDIDYRNVGDRTAIDAVVYEIVPAGTAFSASASGATVWSCADGAPEGTACEYRAGNVVRGGGGTLAFGLRVGSRTDDGRVYNEVAIWDNGSNGVDPTPENNVDSASVDFAPPEPIPAANNRSLSLLALLLALLGMAAVLRQGRVT